MKASQQIPRNALAWIILCQVLLVAPHALRVPAWLLLLYVAAFAWRVQLYRDRWPAPARWLKLVLIGGPMAGIGASYGSLIGLEPTVALLLAAYALKLVESVSRKDAYVLIFLGFFILVTEFLFTQDFLVVLYATLVAWLLTTALVALHRTGEGFETAPLKLAGGHARPGLSAHARALFPVPAHRPALERTHSRPRGADRYEATSCAPATWRG